VVSSGCAITGSKDGDSAALTLTLGYAIDAANAVSKVTIGGEVGGKGGKGSVGVEFNVTGDLYCDQSQMQFNYKCVPNK